MEEKPKGFAGLQSMLTDVSQGSLESAEQAPSANRNSSDPPPKRDGADDSARVLSVPAGHSTGRKADEQGQSATSGSNSQVAFWLVIAAMVGIVVLIAKGHSSPPSSDAPQIAQPPQAPPAKVLPFFPLPEPDGQHQTLLQGMINASQSDDQTALNTRRAAIDKLPKPAPPADPVVRKQSREKNAAGTQLLNTGSFLLAAQTYYDGLTLNPADAEIADNLGYALLKAGEFDESRKALLGALSLSPSRANSWNSLGGALAALGRSDEADGAFVNGWRFSRARSKTLSLWLTLASDDGNVAIRQSVDRAYTRVAGIQAGSLLQPILPRLRASGIPAFLPWRLTVDTGAGTSSADLSLIDNQTYPLKIDQAGYTILIGTIADCAVSECLYAQLQASRGSLPALAEGQESVSIGEKSTVIFQAFPRASVFVFNRDGVNYTFTSRLRRDEAIGIAKTMLASGPIAPSPASLLSLASPQAQGAQPPARGSFTLDPPAIPPPRATFTPDPPAVQRQSGQIEEPPPVGAGLVLSDSQIRYCLAENMRVKAQESLVNSNSQGSVAAFNFRVDDYNSRCSNYRYRAGRLEALRNEVEMNRTSIMQEGIARAAANP